MVLNNAQKSTEIILIFAMDFGNTSPIGYLTPYQICKTENVFLDSVFLLLCMVLIKLIIDLEHDLWPQKTLISLKWVTVNSYPCQLAPCQLVPMSTRTHVNSYHQVMSTRTTSDVNSYPTTQVSYDGTSWHLLSHKRCQLVPMSIRTTHRC